MAVLPRGLGHGPRSSDSGFDRVGAFGSGVVYAFICVLPIEILPAPGSSARNGRRRRRPACSAGRAVPGSSASPGCADRHRALPGLPRGQEELPRGREDRRDCARRSNRRISGSPPSATSRAAVVFGLVGIFLLKAAYRLQGDERSGWTARWRSSTTALWLVAPRRRRGGPHRVRGLLARRSALPQDLGESVASAHGVGGRRTSRRSVCQITTAAAPAAASAGKARSTAGGRLGGARPRCGPATRSRSWSTAPQALPRIADELAAGALARPPHRLVLLARLRPRAGRRAHRPPQPARGAGRADRRPGARLGGRAAAALPPVAARGAADARRLTRAHADPVRARREGAAAALPPREDDRDRRPGRVRRRHRPDLGGRRPLRHAATIPRAARSAGTTRAPGSKGPAVRTSPSTSGCAGTR